MMMVCVRERKKKKEVMGGQVEELAIKREKKKVNN